MNKINKLITALDMTAAIVAWLIELICIIGALATTTATIFYLFTAPVQALYTAAGTLALLAIAYITENYITNSK